VRERIGYHESIGDLTPGEVTPGDVAGTVLLRAHREFASRSAAEGAQEPRERAIGPWLQELATKQLQSVVDRLQAARSRVIHLEQDIPETPPAEAVSTLAEEVLYFYQPDEDLKVEDIFPDADMATPEEFVGRELERIIGDRPSAGKVAACSFTEAQNSCSCLLFVKRARETKTLFARRLVVRQSSP
jgi:hypothetical protein